MTAHRNCHTVSVSEVPVVIETQLECCHRCLDKHFEKYELMHKGSRYFGKLNNERMLFAMIYVPEF